MKNEVLSGRKDDSGPSALDRAVDRALSRQRAAYAREAGRLVEATLRLIRERGVLEPSVAAIVRAARLSNQAFYRHFRTKHELLVAVLDEGIRLLAAYLEERMAKATTPAQQVEEWLRGVLEQALHPRGAAATRPFAVRRSELAMHHPEEVARSEQQLTQPLIHALEAARAAGALPQVDPQRDGEALYHLALGWLEARLEEPTPARREDAERLVAFAMSGLRGMATRETPANLPHASLQAPPSGARSEP
jgi:AcrR family transcriptional regulator